MLMLLSHWSRQQDELWRCHHDPLKLRCTTEHVHRSASCHVTEVVPLHMLRTSTARSTSRGRCMCGGQLRQPYERSRFLQIRPQHPRVGRDDAPPHHHRPAARRGPHRALCGRHEGAARVTRRPVVAVAAGGLPRDRRHPARPPLAAAAATLWRALGRRAAGRGRREG